MYFCNKCGYMGETGPGHCKPTHYLGKLTACGYDAVKGQSDDRMPLNSVANVLAGFLPEGWEVCLHIERGAVWVTLHDEEGADAILPDAADKSLVKQLGEALQMAHRLTPN